MDVVVYQTKRLLNKAWRGMLREAKRRREKRERDKKRWQEQKKNLLQYSRQLPDPAQRGQTDIIFTKNAVAKMKAWGLSESDCLDVFRHGEKVKENMLARKYNGYEIGIVYGRDKRSGQYLIFSCWKRDRY